MSYLSDYKHNLLTLCYSCIRKSSLKIGCGNEDVEWFLRFRNRMQSISSQKGWHDAQRWGIHLCLCRKLRPCPAMPKLVCGPILARCSTTVLLSGLRFSWSGVMRAVSVNGERRKSAESWPIRRKSFCSAEGGLSCPIGELIRSGCLPGSWDCL